MVFLSRLAEAHRQQPKKLGWKKQRRLQQESGQLNVLGFEGFELLFFKKRPSQPYQDFKKMLQKILKSDQKATNYCRILLLQTHVACLLVQVLLVGVPNFGISTQYSMTLRDALICCKIDIKWHQYHHFRSWIS